MEPSRYYHYRKSTFDLENDFKNGFKLVGQITMVEILVRIALMLLAGNDFINRYNQQSCCNI